MKTLGVITARSGSKGIRDKNIRNLDGKPLIAYTIESARNSIYIDEVMVSTDSENYADISRKFGASVPFLRSEKNSTDTAKSVDVLLEVLDEYKKVGQEFDNVVLLQPTSPLRTYKSINSAFDRARNASGCVLRQRQSGGCFRRGYVQTGYRQSARNYKTAGVEVRV